MNKIAKNQYAGKRCFVVASGTSIKEMDLTPLRNEIVICVNESYRALDFDPTFICIGDRELWPRIKDAYAKKQSHIVCGSGLNGCVGQDYAGDNLHAVFILDKNRDMITAGFNFDLEKPLVKAWNVIPEVVLPFVCWAGFAECYLVGCDCTNAGYFYNDPLRGEGWQKVDDRTMDCYAVIAKTEGLPTRIYNATVGGKLEAFPRVSFTSIFKKSRHADLLVIGYYTPDRDYKELAENMKRSVERHGLPCVIRERPTLCNDSLPKPMPWVLNCSQCGEFVADMMREYPMHRLLYLDADASMLNYPEIFMDDNFNYDFAVPFLDNEYVSNELQSNTLYFAPTAPARELVSRWVSLQRSRNEKMLSGAYRNPYKEAWDQRVLQDVLFDVPGLRWTALPWEYGKLDPTAAGVELMKGVKPEEIVIAQHQASRRNKRFL